MLSALIASVIAALFPCSEIVYISISSLLERHFLKEEPFYLYPFPLVLSQASWIKLVFNTK